MRRQEFIAGFGSAAAWPIAAQAQQPATPVMGFLSGQTADDDYNNFTVPFLQGVQQTGYVEGERWTRTGPTTLEYVVTIEDPTVWTRPWTVREEFAKQSEQENRICHEPRCIEGNHAFPALLWGARIEDRAFSEGRGPHPATRDNASGFIPGDPLQ